ncbi:MAG: hypothetical protein CML68_19075 [Rhodobacteraceae bacterium]|nr:hypothetical protein [Paracoccaceae bacterium]
MRQLLAAPDPDVRIPAVDVLRLLPSPEMHRWLAELLARETHENVVATAIDRLAEIGGPEHLDVLHDVRTRFASVPYITFATDLVISRITAEAANAEDGP